LSTAIIDHERLKSITSRISIIHNFNTTKVHNFYSMGPSVGEVENLTNRKIDRIRFSNVDELRQENRNANPQKIYRPEIENPRPHEFRSAKAGRIKPIRSMDDWPSSQRQTQRNNLERLPLYQDGFARGGNGIAGLRARR
jgi:hypothetical protein